MSEENKGNEAEGQVDPIKNVKAEFDRKVDNIANQLAQQNAQMQALFEQTMAALNQGSKPAASQPTQGKKLADLALEDADAFERELDRRVEERASKIVNSTVDKSNATNAVVATFANDYPELRDVNSDLSKAALEAYKTIPKTLQGTPEGTEMAILKAVAKQGIQPASKRRKSSEEDFSVPGNSGNPGGRTSSNKKDGEISERTLQLAQAFGRDIKDPKVIESLKNFSKRDYKKYQE